jgi:transcription elongation factor GreA
MAAQIHLLSPAAHERLRAEHEDLTTRGRIERAREMGDLKENGDYHAAKDLQGMMEDRIRRLEGILENCEISDAVDDGTIGISSKVTILFEGDSEDMAETYLVDSVEERRNGIEVITPASPMGGALMGSREGVTVSYAAPNGSEIRVKILKVELS